MPSRHFPKTRGKIRLLESRAARRVPLFCAEDRPLPEGWHYVGYTAGSEYEPDGRVVILTHLLDADCKVVEELMPLQSRTRTDEERARAQDELFKAAEAARKRGLRARQKEERAAREDCCA